MHVPKQLFCFFLDKLRHVFGNQKNVKITATTLKLKAAKVIISYRNVIEAL